jgi:hypothetical protein
LDIDSKRILEAGSNDGETYELEEDIVTPVSSGVKKGGGVGVVTVRGEGGFDARDLNANFFFGTTLAFSVASNSPISFNCYVMKE